MVVSRLRSLWAELEPTPARWRRAARVGLITALGAGVTAAVQISNPLGLTLLFNFALPEAALSLERGTVFVAAAAIFQLIGLAVVGALVNAPIVHLTVFILLCLVTTYLIYAVPTLGRLWVWIQVPVVTAFYLAMFIPDAMGENGAEAFAGMALAVGFLLLCNGIVRPKPAEGVLAESIASMVARMRTRLATATRIIVGELPGADDSPIAPRLAQHLSLLAAARSAGSAARRAALLADLTMAEAIRGQVERIASIAPTAGARPLPEAAAGALTTLAAAGDRRLERYETLSGAADGRAPGASVCLPGAAIARLDAAAPDMAPVTAAFARIDQLLERNPHDLPPEADNDLGTPIPLAPRPSTSRSFMVRFSTRHTIALTVAFLIGLWDNNPALHAAIWLLMLGGPPSHGATVRKFTMRAIGSSGALALAALGTILVAPNFTSPAPYMAAMFVGTMLMAYIGEGGGILSYLAIGGTAFVIAYGGPGPRPDVIGSIWSIWGISLGMVIRAVVSLLWRERASRTLAEQFQEPLEAMIGILKAGDGGDAMRRRAAAENAAIDGIAMMLTVANDAMLEGRSAGIDAAGLVDALDTLRRLSFAIANLLRLQTAATAFNESLQVRFEAWLGSLREQTDFGVISRAPLRKMVADAAAPALEFPSGNGRRDATEFAAAEHIALLVRRLEAQLAAVSLY